MIYALIKDGEIKNIIVVNDLSFIGLIAHEWEFCKRIDNLDIIPQIGWKYSASENTYSPPEEN